MAVSKKVSKKNKSKKGDGKSSVFRKGDALSKTDAIKAAGVHRDTFMRWVKGGILPAYRGKYDVSLRPELFFKKSDIEKVLSSDVLVPYVVSEETTETKENEEEDTTENPTEEE